jgi:Sortase domain
VRKLLVLGAALALLAIPSASLAGEPPNPHDPCSSGGRDTCGTTGVGFYGQSPFGIRWFGDYRGAVSSEVETFCIDLGYWYPSPKYKYRENATETLRNRSGATVPLAARRRIAYAIWTFGRTSDPTRQGAVMLYVHSQMGDARPGEVNPSQINKTLVPIVQEISTESVRYHGPYRVAVGLRGKLVPGKASSATVRVLAASGSALPNQRLAISAKGAKTTSSATTNGSGVATVTVMPTNTGAVVVTASTTTASTNPQVYTPTTAAAARNGQRLAAPNSQTVTGQSGGSAQKAQVGLSSNASPATVLTGATSKDQVTVSGALNGTVSWQAFGPFVTAGAISCSDTPVAKGSFTAKGAGTYSTAAVTFKQPGIYVFKETVAETASHVGAVTPCTDPNERVTVQVQPTVKTAVSSSKVEPGTALTDSVTVSGLQSQPATVKASLYGPFASQAALNCTTTAVWTGSVAVTKDGTYKTEAFTVKTPGYYVYRESIAAQGFVRAYQTTCADTAETSIVVAHPKISTEISTQKTKPGASIVDRVAVSGLGAAPATVRAVLWGPFASRSKIVCSGTPRWSGSFGVKADGTYTTASVKLNRAGYYTYQESIAQAPANTSYKLPCAETAETTVALATASVRTAVSADVVVPGGALSDTISVTGLGTTTAAIDVALYGPFGTRAAVGCKGAPVWQGKVYAQGDGTVSSPAVHLKKVGFYTFHESLVGTSLITGVTTACPLVAETSLVRPEIITGRGDVTRTVRAGSSSGSAPVHLKLARLGINAPVDRVGIDVPRGVLGVSSNIDRTAWWADGAAPEDHGGSVLIAGHVDSAAAGAGALFRLHEALPGDRVEVVTASGRTRTYRVVSEKTYRKKKLPADVYSRRGRPRLVVVTCGGPFIPAAGHYRDNIVVTAVPT